MYVCMCVCVYVCMCVCVCMYVYTCKVVVLRNKLIDFLTSSLPSPSSLLKLPFVAKEGGTHSHRPLRFVTSHLRFALASARKTKNDTSEDEEGMMLFPGLLLLNCWAARARTILLINQYRL